jgi:hypothetical protein
LPVQPRRAFVMPTTTLSPSSESVELIPEPVSNDPRIQRRFFAFLQKWRNWLSSRIGRSHCANKALADRGVDDLLALTFLVQFVRDRCPDAIRSFDQLAPCRAGLTLGQLCTDLQVAAVCPVLKIVFDPARFAGECPLPASVMERAFWRSITQASRKLYGEQLPVTIFGDLHQWSLAFSSGDTPGIRCGARSETRRYDKGIHYTPPALVNYLTCRVLGQAFDGLSPEQICERRILDPSCGCGVFLVAALRYVFARLEKAMQATGTRSQLSLQDRLDILSRIIVGTDLDAQAVEWTIRSLLLTAWEGLGRSLGNVEEATAVVPDLSGNIVARDFLTSLSAGSATPGAFSSGKIDIVLGGPPFVRLQQMRRSNPAAVARYKRKFRTACSGQFDLYFLFIERAIDLLASNGWLGFSVSNTFLRSESGRVLRRLIAEKCQVHDIIELEDPKIYPDAVIQIALVLLQKTCVRQDGRHVWIRGRGGLPQKLTALASASAHASVEIRPLAPGALRSDRWFFQSAEETDLLTRIKTIGEPLNGLAIHVGQGIVTGADDVFLLKNLQQEKDGKMLVEQRETSRRFWIESDILRPIIRNRDIRGYLKPSPSTLCLAPCDQARRILNEETLQREFPHAHHYLLSCKGLLATARRKRLEAWYAFTSVAGFRFSGHAKVIGGLITSGGDMTILGDAGGLCHSGVLVMVANKLLIDPYYLLGVCNSSVFWAFVQHQMPTMGVGRHALRLERVRLFPLVVPDKRNQSTVQLIATVVQKLVHDPPLSLDRAAIKADIDRMVRELYEIE